MATEMINVYLSYKDELAKIENVPKDIPLAALKEHATKSFGISGNIKIQRLDKDIDKWLLLGGKYELEHKEQLKVIADQSKASDTRNEVVESTDNAQSIELTPAQKAALTVKWKAEIQAAMQSNSGAQGIAFVIGTQGPAGVTTDLDNMVAVFRRLNFTVMHELNKTADDIKAMVQAAASIGYPRKHYYKYIAFYYAGHGGSNISGDSFIKPLEVPGVDEKNVFIESDVIAPFENGQKNKNLLFFFDCCSTVTTDDSSFNPKARNGHPATLVAYATAFGEKSWGNKTYGGAWTRLLSQYLDNDMVLTSILGKVKEEIGNHQNCYYESGLGNVNLRSTVEPLKVSPLKKEPELDDAYSLVSKENNINWDKIGQALGVSYDQRQAIGTNMHLYPTYDKRMQAVLNAWITEQTSDVTWKHLIETCVEAKLMKLAGEIQRYIEDKEVQERYAYKPDWVKTKVN